MSLSALVIAGTAGAANPGNAYNYIQSGGFSYGSQTRWTVGAIGNNADDTFAGGFTAHSIWVGTNGSTFVGPAGATWVELGVTRGWQMDPGLYYYSAHAINYSQVYGEVNLNELPCCTNAPLPAVGENHLFGVLNSHGDSIYFVGVDNIMYWSWNGHSPPSPDYGIGMETTCSGCSGTYVRRTPVTSPQWEDVNFNFYNADNGSFRQAGGISGVTQLWCGYPTSFVDALSTAGVTC
ncbi:MAG: hypothetical protein M3540_09785 [Actinomycetota bacterium]|nr:hypothetical protein [Actinomycetota bacterium]